MSSNLIKETCPCGATFEINVETDQFGGWVHEKILIWRETHHHDPADRRSGTGLSGFSASLAPLRQPRGHNNQEVRA